MDEQPIQERMDFLGGGVTLRPRPDTPDVSGPADVLARALSLTQPLVFLDLETTGLDPRQDRIVELSLARVTREGAVETLSTLVDPGVPVPPSSSAVHGILAADLAGAPTFPDLAARVARLLRGADVAGYNLLRFDLPLLRAEMERAGVYPSWDLARVVDASVVFRRMERRNLEAAHAFYVGGEMDAAHTAAGDVAATMRVLAGQIERYPDLPRTIEDLAVFCAPPPRPPTDEDGSRDAGAALAAGSAAER